MNKLKRPIAVGSGDWLGDITEPCTCEKCGKNALGLGWPSPRLCDKCAPKEPKACPFCGIQGALWRLKDDDGTVAEYFLQCAVCHARGPRAELIEVAEWYWNRRMSPNDES